MTKKLLDNFFLNLGKEIKSKELNAELVEATINQYKAEIKEQIIALEELSKVHKQENQLISQAFAEGQKQSLEKSILLLRKLHTDILWKQLNINMNEKSSAPITGVNPVSSPFAPSMSAMISRAKRASTS